MPKAKVTIIGGGLAGSECAWQLAQRGVPVTLREMKPQQKSPAHKADTLAELVCSNSFRSDNADSAVGMLHAELRSLGSVVMAAADLHRVPAGEALAVDRDLFSREVTSRLVAHPLIEVVPGEVTQLPAEGQVVIATGPLTSDALAKSLESLVGSRLYFYDSIAPIVSADSVDMNVAFRQSRWGKGNGDDYLNLPLTKEEYLAFVQAIRAGEKLQPHAFEEPRYFEGCLPIEVMAERGDEVLSHGPMKPVGLTDPRTGRWPHAVIQLRREDRAGTAYNMVGFQTRLTWGEQKRIFRALPGLQDAEFLRMGQIHRNTFIDSPRLLGPGLALKSDPRIRFAGQITGVEGYVESTACGLLAALAVVAEQEGQVFTPPPATCAMGALYRHVTGEAHPDDYRYQPTNVIYGLFPPLPGRVKKDQKRARYGERGRSDFAPWRAQVAGATHPAPEAVGNLPAAVAPMKEALS